MKRSIFKTCTASLVAASGALFLAACDAAPATETSADGDYSAAALDPYLADPAVGDLWAAKLDEFSAHGFSSGADEASSAYGLMKVVEVNDERVMVVTESGAWEQPDGSLNDLRGDLSNITWDESETIPINRADFASLVASEHILETRRMGE